MRVFWVLLLTAALWQPGLGAADAVTARGTALAQTCITCHGPEGQSQGAIPSLATLASADMRAALQAFRAETRPSTVMHRIARGLNEDDMAAVAAYFATLDRLRCPGASPQSSPGGRGRRAQPVKQKWIDH